MDELYRMLGKEHEADLERDALKWRRAAEVRGSQCDPPGAQGVERRRKAELSGTARAVAFLGRAARAVAFVAR
jgi:hypothetical protein